MNQIAQLVLFDYSPLNPETRIVVEQKTDEIKVLLRRTAQDSIDIGQKLVQVKAHLGHGNFGNWLQAEFNWSQRTAQNFINVFEKFGSNAKKSADLNMCFSALALLAAPSTPEEARETAIALAEAGEKVTLGRAKAIAEQGKLAQLNTSPLEDTAEKSTEVLDAIAEKEIKDDYWSELDGEKPIAAKTVKAELSPVREKPVETSFKPPVEKFTAQNGHLVSKSSATTENTDLSDASPPWKQDRASNMAKSSKTDEHPTPASITDYLYLFFWMKIDLDPCSDPGKNIQAKRHFLKEDDGLSRDWCNPDGSPANVFVNPPFSETAKWVEKAIVEQEKGHIANLVFLSKFDSRVRWFESLMEKSDLFLLVKGYTIYEGNDGNPALFSTVLWFFGERKAMFEDTFDNKLGWVFNPASRLAAQKEPDSSLSKEKMRRQKTTK
jgi:hypothetical protein